MSKKITLSIISISIIAFMSILFYSAVIEDNSENQNYFDRYKANYHIYNPPIPQKANFAGESVPMENFYVYENLERELLTNTYWHSNTLLLFKRANRYFPVIEKILKENQIPDDFKYLALIESSLTTATSSAGARGYWQLMKAAAEDNGLIVNEYIDERNHLEKSTLAAIKYLKNAYAQTGNWTFAAAGYNMGVGGITRQITRQQVESFYDISVNSETNRYIYRILAAKYLFESPKKYGFELRPSDLYWPIPSRTISLDTSNMDWVQFAQQNGLSYKTLRELNPWILQSELKSKSKIKMEVTLPSEKNFNYLELKTNKSNKPGIFGDIE
jgi:hypothetical protein